MPGNACKWSHRRAGHLLISNLSLKQKVIILFMVSIWLIAVRWSPGVAVHGEADLVDGQQTPQHSLARRQRSEHLCVPNARVCMAMPA